MSKGLVLAPILGGLLVFSSAAAGCESASMKTTDDGFIVKVVGGSDRIEVRAGSDSKETAFTLAPLTPYHVICEEGQFYKITSVRAQTVEQAGAGKTGYVLKSEVHVWPTREALRPGPFALDAARPEVVAWHDAESLRKFLGSGDAKLAPPSFRDDLQSILRREPAMRPFPVLDSRREKLRGTLEKRIFRVLLPATSPDAKIVFGEPGGGRNDALLKKLEKAMTSTTVAVAYDATSDMDRLASAIADRLKAAVDGLPKDILNALRIGFVFFRDETDEEKYLVIEPQNVGNAISALRYAARGSFMRGGGDPAEPVLDAVYIAQHFFPWDDAGRKLVVAVLGDDAKPTTIGKIHDGVPAGLTPSMVAADLVDDGIKVISVQNFPRASPNLGPVLSTLGEATGGTFIRGGKEDGTDQTRQIAAALVERIVATARETYVEGQKDLSFVQSGEPGNMKLPLAVLDGEKLARLRAAGIGFSIDAGKGALLSQGYLVENDELLEPVIQIDKQTLERLIAQFSSFGAISVDAAALKECAVQILAAIDGEAYDPSENVDTTVKKQLGIQFRTRLLDINIGDLSGMNPAERLAMARRIQDAGAILSRFLEAHREDFDKSPAVWIPIAYLP
ncbi:hypothetical protein PMI42_03475 [Bradyrhizobium sp. YR681]|uniref:hypothetical protein n=1 Tax=Bradyrhizobium sp. YR681 TaxID=1144344 RepID=UPI000270EED9|nr:hypothetical protein [Bradyrhizobium sp. YR681]EJN13183.1 hypothetical protein PMI42_03475 [Bradyrhizobium sp. YR681]